MIDWKSLPKNKNALLIGAGVLMTVILLLATNFSGGGNLTGQFDLKKFDGEDKEDPMEKKKEKKGQDKGQGAGQVEEEGKPDKTSQAVPSKLPNFKSKKDASETKTEKTAKSNPQPGAQSKASGRPEAASKVEKKVDKVDGATESKEPLLICDGVSHLNINFTDGKLEPDGSVFVDWHAFLVDGQTLENSHYIYWSGDGIQQPYPLVKPIGGKAGADGDTISVKYPPGTGAATVTAHLADKNKKDVLTCSYTVDNVFPIVDDPPIANADKPGDNGDDDDGDVPDCPNGYIQNGFCYPNNPNPNPPPPPPPPPNPSYPPADSDDIEELPKPPPLKATKEIIGCKLNSKNLILPTSSAVIAKCSIKPTAYVTAMIVKGTVNPQIDIAEEDIIQTFFTNKEFKGKGSLNVPVNLIQGFYGIDQYDNTIEAGDYTFLISAVPDFSYKPDRSILPFKVLDTVPIVETKTEVVEEEMSNQSGNSTPVPSPPPTPTPTLEPSDPPPLQEISKCNTPYPNDIEGHWGYDAIRQAYDLCITKGFADGTFRPNEPMNRIDALRAGLITAGIQPKMGCYNKTCGSPFIDLGEGDGPWVRVAWDIKVALGFKVMVNGKPALIFGPQQIIKRSEFAALVAKIFKAQPHAGCYDPHCGAGYPNNIFYDIDQFWVGAYLRGLLDLKPDAIQGVAPHQFAPNKAVTRAEAIKVLVKMKGQ